jgi:transposase
VAQRQHWRRLCQDLDPGRLICIDETAASTEMARRFGRVRRGERCVAAVPHGPWKTSTFVAGLRVDGVVAPMLLDGPMDRPAFLAYVQQVLVRSCAPAIRSSWTICRRTKAEAAGATLLYLPPYSPDFNPIEMAFAKLKAILRAVAARDVAILWQVVADAIPTFSAEECRHYFTAAGYAPI